MVDSSTRSRTGTGRATYCNAGDILSESTTRGNFSQHFLHPRTREDDRGALISVQLSTIASAAAIHTSSCTAVVDEHHTGHQLQELHPAGKLLHRLKLVEIDDADNECTPPLKRKASYVRAEAASGLDSLEFSSRLDLNFPMFFLYLDMLTFLLKTFNIVALH